LRHLGFWARNRLSGVVLLSPDKTLTQLSLAQERQERRSTSSAGVWVGCGSMASHSDGTRAMLGVDVASEVCGDDALKMEINVVNG